MTGLGSLQVQSASFELAYVKVTVPTSYLPNTPLHLWMIEDSNPTTNSC